MTRTILLVLAMAWSTVALAAPKVTVTDSELVLPEPIYFDVGKPTIKKQSYPLLDAIVATLHKADKIDLVEIQVHTDARGNDQWNLDLSQARAEAIRDYLVSKGVDTKRLRPKGYGETKPIDRGNTEKAWAKNRRTQLVIVRKA